MEGLDYWRLCDELNIVVAALLIIGQDPDKWVETVEKNSIENRPSGYEATKSALIVGLRRGEIEGYEIPEYALDQYGEVCGEYPNSIDVYQSKVTVASLRNFLRLHGVSEGFFFPEVHENVDYLDHSHPCYAPKLAAAVRAWQAVSSASTQTSGLTPKKALTRWLNEHAKQFDLTNEDGRPNESGIDQVAKVANWNPQGGAPRTPVREPKDP